MPEARAAVRVITSIDDPEVIEKVLAHLGETHAPGPSLIALQPESGAPPMRVDGWRLSSEGTPQGCEPGIGADLFTPSRENAETTILFVPFGYRSTRQVRVAPEWRTELARIGACP